jgi:hypothetical protein
MKFPRLLIVSGIFAMVPTAERLVDGQLAGLLLRAPDETQFVRYAPEFMYANTVSSSSTNFVMGMDAPTGW